MAASGLIPDLGIEKAWALDWQSLAASAVTDMCHF